MDRKLLKDNAKAQIKGHIGVLFLVTLVVAVVSYAVQLIPGVGSFVSLLVAPTLTLATSIIYLNLTDGINPEVKELFNHFDKFWPAFKVNFLTSLFTVLWSLLLVVPGIIKAFAYSQAMYILAENPTIGAREALKQSEDMMRGHKMELFVLSLSFIGWYLLSVITFGIALIWVGPYVNATMASYYKYLKTTV